MKSAVIYARTSTELQEKEQTIQSQIETLKDYAKEHDYEIIEQYLDDGWSGTLLARPALDRLRDDAQKKVFEAVLIYDPDRLARRFAYQALVTDELEDLGIEVVFLNRPRAETPEDKVLQGFQGLFAEYERAKIMERTRRGKLHKARNNKIVGNTPPYGYRYIPKTKTKDGYYLINEKEAEIVRMIFNWVANEGCSMQEVRKRLFEKGIKARKSGSAKWQNSTLSRLLHNETYIGTTYYNKTFSVIPENSRSNGGYKRVKKSGRRYKAREEWFPISVSAILKKEVFDRVQEQLKKNFFFGRRNQKHEYLLSGLVFCECGSRMAGDGTYRGADGRNYFYYRCTRRVREFPLKSACRARSIRADLIEKVVWDKICRLIENPELVLEQLKNQREKQKETLVKVASEIGELDKKIKHLEAEERRLIEAYRSEVISLSQLKEQLEGIRSERQVFEEQKEKISKEPLTPELNVDFGIVEHYCQLIRKHLPQFEFEDKRRLLCLLLDEVIIKDKQVTIRGILPAIQADVSQSLLRSDRWVREHPDSSGSRHFFPIPSILYHRRSTR